MNQVIIVGGGIAGLYAAEQLAEKGLQVTLLEASNRFGGNIHTYYSSSEEIQFEEGPARFNKYHTILLQLLQKYGLQKIPLDASKQYIPVLCPGKGGQDVSYDLIKKVIQYSEHVSDDILKQISFGQLCEIVLGYKRTKFLIESFGYNAEFLVANAYSSIIIFKEDFNGDTQYYICAEGFSELVKRMVQRLETLQVKMFTYHRVDTFRWNENHFEVDVWNLDTNKKLQLKTSHLMLALPKRALLKQDFFQENERYLLESVAGINLHRIYAKYTKPWFQDIDKTSTDLQIRQFIPVDKKKNVVMVSYTDMFDADYWKTYADMGSDKLEEQIKKQLKQMFPGRTIPKMEWVKSYFWKDGVHSWRAGVDPIKVQKQLQMIHPKLHIVGESYSMRQGWIEGALESVKHVLPQIYKVGSAIKYTSYHQWLNSLLVIKKQDLEIAKLQFPNFKWVLLQLPKQPMYLIDVTRWMNIHPGGAEPFVRHMYEDITPIFLKIPYHYDGKTLKPEVLKMIEKFQIKKEVVL